MRSVEIDVVTVHAVLRWIAAAFLGRVLLAGRLAFVFLLLAGTLILILAVQPLLIALQAVDESKYDVVLSDIVMPGQ